MKPETVASLTELVHHARSVSFLADQLLTFRSMPEDQRRYHYRTILDEIGRIQLDCNAIAPEFTQRRPLAGFARGTFEVANDFNDPMELQTEVKP